VKGLYIESISLKISCIKKEGSNFVYMKTGKTKVDIEVGLKRSKRGNIKAVETYKIDIKVNAVLKVNMPCILVYVF
jgi:hypothetical protein